MTPGGATPQGCSRLISRFPRLQAAGFYREAQGLQVSSLGLGSYLGPMNQAVDEGYRNSVIAAVEAGLNFIDTSLNYRHQRSERAIAAALQELFDSGAVQRDEVVIGTKAGFLIPHAVPDSLKPEDVVAGMHSMAPAFLADQLERSRNNLGLECIDVFYLHNPETQLEHVSPDEFHTRIRNAFTYLEEAVTRGLIRFYGTATWDGYRRGPNAPPGLSLDGIAADAEAVAGPAHHFRFIQLPFNLAMPEAYTLRRNDQNILETAAKHGITVVASASLLQSRLARNLPGELVNQLAGLTTDAARAIQFTRSTPGITVALVGMSNPAHVRENLEIAGVPPLSVSDYNAIYRQA